MWDPSKTEDDKAKRRRCNAATLRLAEVLKFGWNFLISRGRRRTVEWGQFIFFLLHTVFGQNKSNIMPSLLAMEQ